MRYVGVGRRAVALLVDSAFLFGPIALILVSKLDTIRSFMESPPGPGTSTIAGVNAAFGWIALAWFTYMIVMEASFGATLGKFALGIRVVRVDGSSIDVVASVIRNLVRAVDGQFGGIVGAIIIWNSSLRQRLGDKAAGTVVVPAAVAREAHPAHLARSVVPVAMRTPPRPD
jgi:uncharacterized RDD family membrane protein YckC